MAAQRLYCGQKESERQRQRCERLIAAAIMLYGRHGYRTTGVRAVCQEAGLTERYFYESFANSEAMLVACFDLVVAHLIGQIRSVGADIALPVIERARLRIEAYYEAIRAHPDAARVFLIEISGVSPTIDTAFAHALDQLSELILDTLDVDRTGPVSAEPLLRRGVAGGLLHIALAWLESGYDRALDEVVAAAMPLCLLAEPQCHVAGARSFSPVRIVDGKETG